MFALQIHSSAQPVFTPGKSHAIKPERADLMAPSLIIYRPAQHYRSKALYLPITLLRPPSRLPKSLITQLYLTMFDPSFVKRCLPLHPFSLLFFLSLASISYYANL